MDHLVRSPGLAGETLLRVLRVVSRRLLLLLLLLHHLLL